MASSLTPFYGLSQWLGTDNFSRADFNSDNSKIDTALANLRFKQEAQPWSLIKEYQPGAELTSMSLQLDDIDLSSYLQFLLFVDLQEGVYAESSHYLRLNGDSSATYYRTASEDPVNYLLKTELKSGYPKKRLVRFAPYEHGVFVCCNYESYYGNDAGVINVVATGVKWENLTSIDYVASSISAPIKAGTGLYLYGIKKP